MKFWKWLGDFFFSKFWIKAISLVLATFLVMVLSV